MTDAPGPVVVVLAETKGITREQAEAMNAQVAARAVTVGLDLRFDTALVANTRDAHRLLHLAREHGVQGDVAGRLFRATRRMRSVIATETITRRTMDAAAASPTWKFTKAVSQIITGKV